MASFAKLCDPEAELSIEDALVLHHAFLSRYNEASYAAVTAYVGGFEDSTGMRERLFVNSMGLVLVTPQGRAWLERIPLQAAQREQLERSPYAEGDCSDLGPITALLAADREEKARMRSQPAAVTAAPER